LRALSLDYGYNVLFCSVDQTSLGAVLQIVFQPNETWQPNAARMSNLRSPSGLSSSRSSKREPRQRSRLVRRPTPFWSFRPAHGPLRPSALGDEIFPVPHFCVPVPATSSSADWPSDFPMRLGSILFARRTAAPGLRRLLIGRFGILASASWVAHGRLCLWSQ
jgi:hypothetical protein